MIDDERICPKAHDSVRCLPFDRTDETHARTRARSFLKLRRHRRINIRNPLHSRIVYLVLMAASRITTRQKRSRVHRTPVVSLPLSLLLFVAWALYTTKLDTLDSFRDRSNNSDRPRTEKWKNRITTISNIGQVSRKRPPEKCTSTFYTKCHGDRLRLA